MIQHRLKGNTEEAQFGVQIERMGVCRKYERYATTSSLQYYFTTCNSCANYPLLSIGSIYYRLIKVLFTLLTCIFWSVEIYDVLTCDAVAVRLSMMMMMKKKKTSGGVKI